MQNASELQKNVQGQTKFVDFDLNNEVVWFGEALPKPVPIKIEPDTQSPSVDSESSIGVQQSSSYVPTPSTSKVKFPSPAKIGQEAVKLFSRKQTRAAARAENIILPMAPPPPDICPTKTKTLQNQTQKIIKKSTQK